ncbi:hypothetical protein AOLI_G00175290 [Acnodon oligacanthus]
MGRPSAPVHYEDRYIRYDGNFFRMAEKIFSDWITSCVTGLSSHSSKQQSDLIATKREKRTTVIPFPSRVRLRGDKDKPLRLCYTQTERPSEGRTPETVSGLG